MAKRRTGAGKEKVMREMLRVDRGDVEYITKRANASHRRHAAQDGSADMLPSDELAECYRKTAGIIAAFATFLRDAGL